MPVCDTGPFRVSVLTLHHQTDVTFPSVELKPNEPRGAGSSGASGEGRVPSGSVNEQFYAQIQLAGEPRLTLVQTGPLRVVEASDDKGQSLVVATPAGPAGSRNPSFFPQPGGGVIALQVVLSRPEHPGSKIRILRGSLPVFVASRKPNPLVVKLEGGKGQSFKNDDLTAVLHEVRPLGNGRQTSIEVSVRSSTESAGGMTGPGFGGDQGAWQNDSIRQQVEVRDGQARPLTWFQTGYDVEKGRMTLTLTPHDGDGTGPPAELRFYVLARAATDVNFEFHDLPLP